VKLRVWTGLAFCLTVAALATTGIAAFVFMVAALGCACRALTGAIPYAGGLREYRQ
jgi:hypothetical protein